MFEAVWTRAEAKLRRPVTPLVRELFEKTHDREYLEMVLRGASRALEHLVERITQLEPYVVGTREPGEYTRGAPQAPRPGLSRTSRAEGYERSRLDLRTSYLVKMMGADSSVRSLRGEMFNGRRLTTSQAKRWLSSPAPRFLSQNDFRALGIPVRAHTSRIADVRRTAREDGEWFIGKESVSLEISWRGGQLSRVFGYEWRHRDGSEPPSRPAFPVLSDNGNVMRLAGFPNSVFEALQQASQPIAKESRWPEFDASMFVITGIPPHETGIRYVTRPEWTRHLAEEVITLTVDSWVSPETVARTYRDLQQRTLDGRSRAHEKSLEIVKLAIELMPSGGSPPSAEELVKTWNRRFPKEAYADLWRFRSHYNEAFRQLLLPGHIVWEKLKRRQGVNR